jgi:hypothetical protein
MTPFAIDAQINARRRESSRRRGRSSNELHDHSAFVDPLVGEWQSIRFVEIRRKALIVNN